MGRDTGSGVSRKSVILTSCEVLGVISWWGMKIFERCSAKRLTLSRSERASDLPVFLIGQKNSFNLIKFLVVFHGEPSCVFKDLNFMSIMSFLNFWISFLMVLDLR